MYRYQHYQRNSQEHSNKALHHLCCSFEILCTTIRQYLLMLYHHLFITTYLTVIINNSSSCCIGSRTSNQSHIICSRQNPSLQQLFSQQRIDEGTLPTLNSPAITILNAVSVLSTGAFESRCTLSRKLYSTLACSARCCTLLSIPRCSRRSCV